MNKLFIVGCPRSGTTLLQQALNRHSQIAVSPETRYFTDFVGHTYKGQARQLGNINADLNIDLPQPTRRVHGAKAVTQLYDELAERYVRRVKRPEVTYFGEKSPGHLLCLDRIIRLYPQAKVILIHRDGRDVALSLTKVPWSRDDLYFNFAIWLRYARRQRQLAGRRSIQLACVRYEDLVREPTAELRKLTDFLHLTYEPQMADGTGCESGIPTWERAWKGRALEPITSSRVGQWKTALTADQVSRLERWGGRTLRELGYTLATAGTEGLPRLFFPRLYWSQFIWRVRCAARLANRELIAP